MFFYYNSSIKALQLRNGWLRLKLTSIWDSQSSNCPIKILYLDGELKMPKELDYASFNALVIIPRFARSLSQLSVSSLENFSNLRSLRLNSLSFNNDMMSMVSKLSLLEFISLYKCRVANDLLLKIFESCTILQEFRLIFCNYSDCLLYTSRCV